MVPSVGEEGVVTVEEGKGLVVAGSSCLVVGAGGVGSAIAASLLAGRVLGWLAARRLASRPAPAQPGGVRAACPGSPE